MLKKDLSGIIKLAGIILAGNILIAFAVVFFITPGGIIMGGATGLALSLEHFLTLDIAIGVLIINMIFLAVGTIALGKKFFLSTVASSLIFPVILKVVQQIPGDNLRIGDPLLCAVVAGALIGCGAGIIVKYGASTGGTDGLALALNKWTHIEIAILNAVLDILILISQAVFSNIEQILYGIVLTVVNSIIMNRMMLIGHSQMQLFIVSRKHEEIRHTILYELNLGATMLRIESGIAKLEMDGILTIIHPRALYLVTDAIQKIDPDAFMTVVQVRDVHGQGFSKERQIYSGLRYQNTKES